MQRIMDAEAGVEAYVAGEGHRQVRAESVCPRCGRGGRLHRHGSYRRHVTDRAGRAVLIAVARFLCLACRRTISYLPSFALSYRLVQAATVQAFLRGNCTGRDVQARAEVLRGYERRIEAFASEVVRTIGYGFGRGPPPSADLSRWLEEACGSLAAATRRLVTQYKITLFKRYQVHQPLQS